MRGVSGYMILTDRRHSKWRCGKLEKKLDNEKQGKY
jgi:hypothetical protein